MSTYTNPTGEGYVGTYSVCDGRVNVTNGALAVTDWQLRERLFIQVHDNCLRITDTEPESYQWTLHTAQGSATALDMHLSAAKTQAIGVDRDGAVRAYWRDGALVIVDADDDPLVGGDADA